MHGIAPTEPLHLSPGDATHRPTKAASRALDKLASVVYSQGSSIQ